MSRRITHALMVAAVVVAGLVRLHGLGADSIDGAEVAALDAAAPIRILREPEPVAVPLLPRLASRIALAYGYGEGTVRLPSALAGVATVVAVGVVGQGLFGAEAGMYAMLLLALSPLHVGVSRRVDAGVWLTLFAWLTILLGERAAARPERRGRWIGFGVAALATCLCGYAGLLLLATFAVWGGWSLIRVRHATRAAVLFCVLPLLIGAGVGVWALLHPPQLARSLLGMGLNGASLLQVLAGLSTNRPDHPLVALSVLIAALLGTTAKPTRGQSARIWLWALMGIGGSVLTAWMLSLGYQPSLLAPALPAYLLLAGAGLYSVRSGVTARVPAWLGAPLALGIVALVLALELPALITQLQEPAPRWRAAAAVLEQNALPGDALVALDDRRSLVFYAPDLETRFEPKVPPARATAYFVHPPRGWLIAPSTVRFFPGWKIVESWMTRFPPVDLSPGDGVMVYYVGQDSRPQLLLEAAFMDLPAATLVRGSLLLDMLQAVGPGPPLLWKVDQIVLSPRAARAAQSAAAQRRVLPGRARSRRPCRLAGLSPGHRRTRLARRATRARRFSAAPGRALSRTRPARRFAIANS